MERQRNRGQPVPGCRASRYPGYGGGRVTPYRHSSGGSLADPWLPSAPVAATYDDAWSHRSREEVHSMAGRKMLILRGNSAPQGAIRTAGDTISWPTGRCTWTPRRHTPSAELSTGRAKRSSHRAGRARRQTELIKRFLDNKDGSDTAFYGGRLNMFLICYSTWRRDQNTHIKLVVVSVHRTRPRAYKPPNSTRLRKRAPRRLGCSPIGSPGTGSWSTRKDPDKIGHAEICKSKARTHTCGVRKRCSTRDKRKPPTRRARVRGHSAPRGRH